MSDKKIIRPCDSKDQASYLGLPCEPREDGHCLESIPIAIDQTNQYNTDLTDVVSRLKTDQIQLICQEKDGRHKLAPQLYAKIVREYNPAVYPLNINDISDVVKGQPQIEIQSLGVSSRYVIASASSRFEWSEAELFLIQTWATTVGFKAGDLIFVKDASQKTSPAFSIDIDQKRFKKFALLVDRFLAQDKLSEAKKIRLGNLQKELNSIWPEIDEAKKNDTQPPFTLAACAKYHDHLTEINAAIQNPPTWSRDIQLLLDNRKNWGMGEKHYILFEESLRLREMAEVEMLLKKQSESENKVDANVFVNSSRHPDYSDPEKLHTFFIRRDVDFDALETIFRATANGYRQTEGDDSLRAARLDRMADYAFQTKERVYNEYIKTTIGHLDENSWVFSTFGSLAAVGATLGGIWRGRHYLGNIIHYPLKSRAVMASVGMIPLTLSTDKVAGHMFQATDDLAEDHLLRIDDKSWKHHIISLGSAALLYQTTASATVATGVAATVASLGALTVAGACAGIGAALLLGVAADKSAAYFTGRSLSDRLAGLKGPTKEEDFPWRQ